MKDFRLPRQLPEYGLEALLLRVATNAGVSIAFERGTNCHGHQASDVVRQPRRREAFVELEFVSDRLGVGRRRAD